MPETFPYKSRSSYHEEGLLLNFEYDGTLDNPAPPPAYLEFPLGARTEKGLVNRTYGTTPRRGMIKRIVATQISGTAATFELDIVDKPFGGGTPSTQNIIYKEVDITGFTNKIFDIAYEHSDPEENSLYFGIKPLGGVGVYKVNVYIETRG